MRYIDKKNKRLVYTNFQANEAFWDGYWDNAKRDTLYNKHIPKHSFILNQTQKYLFSDRIIYIIKYLKSIRF